MYGWIHDICYDVEMVWSIPICWKGHWIQPLDFDVWSFCTERGCCWANMYHGRLVWNYVQAWNIEQKVSVKQLISFTWKYSHTTYVTSARVTNQAIITNMTTNLSGAEIPIPQQCDYLRSVESQAHYNCYPETGIWLNGCWDRGISYQFLHEKDLKFDWMIIKSYTDLSMFITVSDMFNWDFLVI